ncbi:glutathione S-transferase family protein [Streptomyces sp. enrichment culture]|uniref:glutathione S-transferase family protein n=1 Tax=Streptomyces sp. enrichment culture TaxID=1795815 RepID=UPI003F54FA2E
MSVAPLAPALRARIGPDSRSGHYPVPRRYRLYLSTACPDGLRLAATHALLGLGTALPVTRLPAAPDLPDGGHSALLPLYEASAHRHPGPAAAPVLADDWTGRVVNTHAPDIMSDLAHCFGAGRPALYPIGAEAAIAQVRRLCAHGDLGELRPRPDGYLLGPHPTAADIELWVALVQRGTSAKAPLHPTLAAYLRRLTAHPALRPLLDRARPRPADRP